MNAIILAAGYGTRLMPLTNILPKPLMPVVGCPVLWHTVRKLKKCGFTDIGINIHHKPQMVEKYLKHANHGLNIKTSYERTILGVAGGIGGFRDFLKKKDFFLVHNGDILSNSNLNRLIETYKTEKPLCTMLLHNHPLYNNVCIDNNNNITDIRDTLMPGNTVRKLAYTGIALMDTDILELIPGGPADLIPVLIDIVRQGNGKIKSVAANDSAWMDIGTVENYLDAHREILLNHRPLIDAALIPEGPVFLGKGTQVEQGARLRGFVSTGENCIIKKGCFVKNCVVWDGMTIDENMSFSNAILGNGWTVNAKQITTDTKN